MLAFYGLGLPKQPFDPNDPAPPRTGPVRTRPAPQPLPPQPAMYTCYDGSQATDPALCPTPGVPALYTCPDGSQVMDPSSCPAPQAQPPVLYTCWDGSQATDPSLCPMDTPGLPAPADGSSPGMQITPTQSPDDGSNGSMAPDTGYPHRWRMRNGLLIGGALVGAFALGALLLSRR